LLPAYDYASIDETSLHENKYNWGYDPQNYNVPEGGYSTDPYNPVTRILEFKQMVHSLHKAGIRVIMDVVYNHTYVGENSHLNLLVPGYFYRMKEDGSWSNASGCGNETASERAMMRKFIVESVVYWATEYHIDGFRFDLMGIHDIETMNAVRAALDKIDPTIFVYGEGWTADSSPLPEEQRAIKKNAKELDNMLFSAMIFAMRSKEVGCIPKFRVLYQE
jgi:pullulanase